MNNDESSLEADQREGLFRRAKDGDEEAWGELCADLLRRLRPIALSRAGKVQAMGRTGTDLLNSRMISLLQNPDRFFACHSAQHLFNFLCVRLGFKAQDEFKKQRRDRNALNDLRDLFDDTVFDDVTDIDGLDDASEAVRKLTESESQLVEMVADGVSYVEIGRQLGISDKTAKKRFIDICTRTRGRLD